MATSSSDPVRRPVQEVAKSDSDREVTLSRTTARAEFPLPGGKKVIAEVTHDRAKISRKKD